MRMGSSWEKDKLRMGVTTAILSASVPGAEADLSEQNCIANKARDQAWRIGDQAMNKGTLGLSSRSRGC
ncbi:MAG TPA: hypothetical protein VGK23_09465 [Methanomassiliicoccales archaeon]|jgi:hypothetical protein